MDTQNILEIIVDERNYQDKEAANPSRPDIKDEMAMGEILLAIEYNMAQARTAWYPASAPYGTVTNYLRKVAALCVKAGEQFGMTERE